MALLAVDIGNTYIKLGLFEGLEIKESFRLASSRERTADEYVVLIRGMIQVKQIEDVIIGSVVPPLSTVIAQTVHVLQGKDPIFVNPVAMDLMPLEVDYPSEVGVDRVVNSFAAFREHGGPLIVIDFGTATTFDVVSAEGAYLGGAIAAGAEIAAEALFERTALLPRIELRKPDTEIGHNTRTAMQIGLYEGLLGQVEFIVKRFQKALGEKARVIATGGLSMQIAGECSIIDGADPELSLRGLAMVYQEITSGGKR
jgi:type III pantothenate kinase